MKNQNEEMQKSDFYAQMDRSQVERVGNTELVDRFLSNRTDVLRFVIGKNEESTQIINLFKIDGLIDDFSGSGKKWNGISVFRRSDVPKDTIIVNCSTSISPIAVSKQLTKAGLYRILNVHEVISATEGRINKPWFVRQMHEDYLHNQAKWFELYKSLADEKSKRTLLDVMRFRLSADPIYMQKYKVRFDDQYFENFLNIEQETFVDAGGYDGDTTELFCVNYPNYKKVLFFEPSDRNMEQAKNRLKRFRDITYISEGLSDKSESLSYDPDAGPASSISSTIGSVSIKVDKLDRLVTDPVSFIKMDLEGWELPALCGSKDHIINDSPKLAIAVYHNAKDFCAIKNFVHSLGVSYKVFLRHYSEGWSETVMYFVPN